MEKKTKEKLKAAGATAFGAAVGYGAVAATGASAVGMVGTGAGSALLPAR